MFNLSLPMAGRRAEETQCLALNRKTRQIYLCHYLLISFLRLSRMRQSNQDHHHMITSQFWPSVNRSSSEGGYHLVTHLGPHSFSLLIREPIFCVGVIASIACRRRSHFYASKANFFIRMRKRGIFHPKSRTEVNKNWTWCFCCFLKFIEFDLLK